MVKVPSLGDQAEDLRQTSWSRLFLSAPGVQGCRHSDAQSIVFTANCAWCGAEEGPPRPSMHPSSVSSPVGP